MRQKITATAIALVLGSFAAIGAFASQDKVDFRSVFSGPATAVETPGVDTPTATATVDLTATATDTSTPAATATDTAVPAATDTPSATETVGPSATPGAGCEDGEDGDHAAVGTPVAGASQDSDCDDAHEDQGKHEGLECGQGHHEDDNGDEDGNSSTPTAPADTATPDTSGTPTIVAELPVHCHGEHGVEHDEGQHSGDNHSRDHQEGD